LVHRAPQVALLTVDRDEHLIQVPLVSRSRTAPAQGAGVGLAELRTPLPDGLVAEGDPAGQHHLPGLARARREAVVEPDAVADDLRREPEPLIRRRTDGHPPSSSRKQPGDHPSPADHKVDGALLPGSSGYPARGITAARPPAPLSS